MSATFQSSETVLHDLKFTRRRLRPLRERLSCCLCPGSSINGIPCFHESELVRFAEIADENMLNREASLSNAESDESEVERPMNAAYGMETGIEDDFDVVPDLLINYTSRRNRSFFPCSAGEKSIRSLMSVIFQYGYGDDGPDLFMGRDISLECSCCRYEISPHFM